MTRRHLLVWMAMLLSGALALVGGFIFVGGLVVEVFSKRPQSSNNVLSVPIQVSLAGLCLTAIMLLIWFILAGLLLIRQTREQGSGYSSAYRLMEAFRFGEAVPLLERSIREGRETSDVLMLLTSAYAYSGQLAKAQATADRAVRVFPNDPASYVTLANGYRLQAAYAEAGQALEAALQLSPDEPVIWAELGFVQRLAGENEKSLLSFERAASTTLPPMYAVRVYHHLADHYHKTGNMEKAADARTRTLAARDGLLIWKVGLSALQGTAYGQALHYEIMGIEQALNEAE